MVPSNKPVIHVRRLDTANVDKKSDIDGWQKVAKKGNFFNKDVGTTKQMEKQSFNISTKNRYEKLQDIIDNQNEQAVNEPKNKFDVCGFMFTSSTGLENHKDNAHAHKIKRREAEDKTETTETFLSELDKEKKCHKETKKSLAALEKEYNSCREKL